MNKHFVNLVFINFLMCFNVFSQPNFNSLADAKKYILENSGGYEDIQGVYSVSLLEKVFMDGESPRAHNQILDQQIVFFKYEGKYFGTVFDKNSNSFGGNISVNLSSDHNTLFYGGNQYIREDLNFKRESELDLEGLKARFNNTSEESILRYGLRVVLFERLTRFFPESTDYEEILNRNSTSSGTCFLINKNSIITNYHVVEGKSNFYVLNKKGEKIKVILDKYDSELDIAILNVRDFSFSEPRIVISKNPVSLGDEIYALGYPMISSMGNDIKITNGIISSKSGYMGDTKYVQVSASVNPGNSGGPLVTKRGDLVGVISSKHSQAENSAYALKINYLKAFLDENSVSYQVNDGVSLESNNGMKSMIEKISSAVFIIIAE